MLRETEDDIAVLGGLYDTKWERHEISTILTNATMFQDLAMMTLLAWSNVLHIFEPQITEIHFKIFQ
jgi:hypothetical protein